MNKIEKIVYDMVKSHPNLKRIIRNIYQNIFDWIPDRENFFLSPLKVRENYFFGFHDITPFSNDEKFILANRIEIPLRMPKKGDPLTIGYFDKNMKHYTSIKQTKAWNYHKGCRLQWIGNTNNSFIFNDFIDDHLGACIYSIDNSSFQYLDFPVDTVSPKKFIATNFSYERLNKLMPGYGYGYKDEGFVDQGTPKDTGLFLIHLKENKRELIVSLDALSKIKPDETMRGANHFVTHSEFSPDGERIAFLHRWVYKDPAKRFSRLVTCKLDGSDIRISPTSGMVSHYVWNDRYGILAYCQIKGKDGHYMFKDYTLEKYRKVADSLNSDGHQSYVPNSDYFVTDTYPDRRRYAKIYLVNIKTNVSKKIVDVKSPKKFQSKNIYKHWACDLHPRISPSGRYICFDSVHTGKRALCVMDLHYD